MFHEVTLPLWLLVLIVGFATVTFASHFLFPSVRWFFRKRAERALSHLNTRLDRPIELFKLARRQDMIVRLVYDPMVMEAVAERVAEAGVPGEVAFEDQLPRTAAGKVLKRQLRERFAAAAPA